MTSPNKPPRIIALDGPAASGKSTVGLKIAEALNYLFFDTGVMYRAIANMSGMPHEYKIFRDMAGAMQWLNSAL